MTKETNELGPLQMMVFKELSREETEGLEAVGRSIEVPYSSQKELFSPDKHLAVTRDMLFALHSRAYHNLRMEGYRVKDFAGFVVLSVDELEEERELMQQEYGRLVNVVGTEYFVKSGGRK